MFLPSPGAEPGVHHPVWSGGGRGQRGEDHRHREGLDRGHLPVQGRPHQLVYYKLIFCYSG